MLPDSHSSGNSTRTVVKACALRCIGAAGAMGRNLVRGEPGNGVVDEVAPVEVRRSSRTFHPDMDRSSSTAVCFSTVTAAVTAASAQRLGNLPEELRIEAAGAMGRILVRGSREPALWMRWLRLK